VPLRPSTLFLSLSTTNARRMFRRMPRQIPSSGPIRYTIRRSMKRPANISKLRKLLVGKCEVTVDLFFRESDRFTSRGIAEIWTLYFHFCETSANSLRIRCSILVSHANSDICSTAIFAMSGGIAFPINFFWSAIVASVGNQYVSGKLIPRASSRGVSHR